MKNTTSPATEDPVAQAAREAAEAEAFVQALEERVRNGDESITPDQLTAQEAVARFAQLRAEAAYRRSADEKEAERQAACQSLADEIVAARDDTVTALIHDLRAMEDAAVKYADGVKRFNAAMADWRARALALGVPVGQQGAQGNPIHGGLSVAEFNGELVAGSTRLQPLRIETQLGHVLARIERSTNHPITAISVGADRAYELLQAELGVTAADGGDEK